MEYRHKSGAQKRKEREDRIKKATKGNRTLFQFGIGSKEELESTTLSFEGTSIQNVDAGTEIVANDLIESVGLLPETVINETDRPIIDINNRKSVTNGDSYIQSTRSECTSSGTHEKDGFDIGILPEGTLCNKMIETVVIREILKHPNNFPGDGQRPFPRSILKVNRQNGEVVDRDWLAWSEEKESLFCFPCRLFGQVGVGESSRSILSSDQGWGKQHSWRKLYEKVPAHEKSEHHKKCYIQWRDTERRFLQGTDIRSQIDKEIATKEKYWRDLLHRILSVILFLGERGLAFRGTSNKIGDHDNGNFLGIIELLSQFDPVLQDHVAKVKQSQEEGTRLQAHYLSADSQNELIEACSSKVVREILLERQKAKYFSVLVDATDLYVCL